jgi:IS5 family transposase
LLERNQLGRQLFEAMGAYLEAQGLKLSRGTMVDATILNAPSSTKNAAGAREGQPVVLRDEGALRD